MLKCLSIQAAGRNGHLGGRPLVALEFTIRKLFVRIVHVLVGDLGHLEHVDSVGLEDFLHGVVAEDVPLVSRVLQVVALDVSPELLGDLWSRHLGDAAEKS